MRNYNTKKTPKSKIVGLPINVQSGKKKPFRMHRIEKWLNVIFYFGCVSFKELNDTGRRLNGANLTGIGEMLNKINETLLN